MVRKLGTPFGFWLGWRFIIYFTEANDAEIIINHPNSIDKGGVYKYVEELIGGKGLFTSGGNLSIFNVTIALSILVEMYN